MRPPGDRRRHAVGRGPRRLARRRSWLTVGVAALALAACSATPAPVKVDVGQARTGASRALATLFDLSDPALRAKEAAVQDGASISTTLSQALSSSLGRSSAGARLDSFHVLSTSGCARASLTGPCAEVTYDIDGPAGTTLVPGAEGYAVDIDGRWLVAKATTCAVLRHYYLEGPARSSGGCA
jgi:hypothetical protein